MSNEINSINLDDFFGQPKQGGSDTNWKDHKIEDGKSEAFRIAPPIKSLKAKGFWKFYHRLHYGYSVVNEQNPDKRTIRPFVCIERTNRSTGMLEQDCPECDYIETLEKNLETLKLKAKEKGMSDEQVDEFLKTARQSVREHNVEKKFYVLAKNSAGEWGTLKLGYKTMQQLDMLIAKYQADNDGAHPLDPKGGIWFRVSRTGKGTATLYTVAYETESLGKGQFRLKSGELTLADAQALDKCPDLATCNDNKILTYDQINALVKSKGDPALVSAVFTQPSRRRQTEQAPAPRQSAPVQPSAPAPVAEAPAAPAEDDLDAQIARLQAAKAAKAKPAPVVEAPAPAPSAGKPSPSFNELMNLDPNEFLKMFPDPNAKQ